MHRSSASVCFATEIETEDGDSIAGEKILNFHSLCCCCRCCCCAALSLFPTLSLSSQLSLFSTLSSRLPSLHRSSSSFPPSFPLLPNDAVTHALSQYLYSILHLANLPSDSP